MPVHDVGFSPLVVGLEVGEEEGKAGEGEEEERLD